MKNAEVGAAVVGRVLRPPVSQDEHQHLQALLQALRTAAHPLHP